MKKFLSLPVCSFIILSLSAQQPTNGGFNTWTNPTNPDGWATWSTAFPGYAASLVSQDNTNKTEGTSSVKIMTDSIMAGPTLRLVQGFISLGSASYTPGSSIKFTGIAFPFRPDTIIFSYQYTIQQTDTAMFAIQFTDNSYTLSYIALLQPTGNNWQNIFFTLNDTAYLNNISTTPDSLLIVFQSSFGGGKKDNSTLWVDGLRFGYRLTPVLDEEINQTLKVCVYPNPARDYTHLHLSEPMSGSVMITDVSGRVVTHELLHGVTHMINTAGWSEGIYTYAVINPNGKVISKGKFHVVK
ncbi:MAG: T9SS type A sorting domain-containing protein [Chitinophagales bacterium]|nr:T9SS type A sorting domain-containing protein [Chitinophagales bacterium]MDW8419138.1 T9SS type A sorting domain-containing protein [Chitinophagales bacterium]